MEAGGCRANKNGAPAPALFEYYIRKPHRVRNSTVRTILAGSPPNETSTQGISLWFPTIDRCNRFFSLDSVWQDIERENRIKVYRARVKFPSWRLRIYDSKYFPFSCLLHRVEYLTFFPSRLSFNCLQSLQSLYRSKINYYRLYQR